ncbi:hypothetical protein BN1088_470010 [Sphingobacterium sp. PM2-P1-29]|nr:hypothetical protein BN1088_470010 [Sphingobacterium sp. PM2-P1-29]
MTSLPEDIFRKYEMTRPVCYAISGYFVPYLSLSRCPSATGLDFKEPF